MSVRRRTNQGRRKPVGSVWPHAQKRRNDPAKYAAEKAITNAVALGQIQQLPCEVCGSDFTEAHHADYTKPFDVRWLCRTHHRAVHGSRAIVPPHNRTRRRSLEAAMPLILDVTQQVRDEMDRQGLTQADLARIAGVTQPIVHRWFAGGFRTIGSAVLAAQALGGDVVMQFKP